MLGKVLSKASCAKCGFCCSFRRKSLWELPKVPAGFAEKYPKDINGEKILYSFGKYKGVRYAVTELGGKYTTDDPEEEVRCPFLDPELGCMLPDEDKPFDCKIWPLRYMKMPDGALKVCLTPTCPEINNIPTEKMKELVSDGLGDKIAGYARKYPFIIKEYKNGFIEMQ